jgi:hypothetical protein
MFNLTAERKGGKLSSGCKKVAESMHGTKRKGKQKRKDENERGLQMKQQE